MIALPELDPVGRFLLSLLAALTVAKVLGEVAFRLRQSSVLGELLAGSLLGPHGLGWVVLDDSFQSLMTLGVILLLVETGLETSLPALLKVGRLAAAVAITGVLLPLGLGYGFAVLNQFSSLQALTIGATLTATSIGITARTLQDIGESDSREGRIILGAAVLDDILGLALLALLQSLTDKAHPFEPVTAAIQLAVLSGFVLLMFRWAQPVLNGLDRFRSPGALTALTLSVVLIFCLASQLGGFSLVIGAFLAGLLFNRTKQVGTLHHILQPLGHFLAPLFFVGVGAQLDWRQLNPAEPANQASLLLAGGLTLLAIMSKLAAGFASFKPGLRRAFIGMGMVPRGEVGLIFAQVGLSAHVLDDSLFSVLVLTVLLTTFVTPPALSWLKQARLPVWRLHWKPNH